METMLCLDDGCAFGLGAFETIAVENGRPCFLAEHLQRLEEALHFLRIACDHTMLQKRIQDELHCQKLPHHALKLMVSDRNIAVTIRPNPYPGSRRFTGIRLCISPVRRNETSPLTYRKTWNYGDSILEKRRAVQDGWDGCVFLNSRGEIAEEAVSNLFFLKDGQLFTPPETAGLLPGIIRGHLLRQFAVREVLLKEDDLSRFDGCFLTNSLCGLRPVARIGSYPFPLHPLRQFLRLHDITPARLAFGGTPASIG